MRAELGVRAQPPTPRENHPPSQMIPAGRKVYTGSQLKQKAKEQLVARYKEEADNA